MDLEKGLYTELSTLNASVYPVMAPQDTSAPYVVYTLSNNKRLEVLTGVVGLVETMYEIEVYGATYTETKDLAASIVHLLQTLEGSAIGTTTTWIQQVTIENEIDMYEPETRVYRHMIEITIYYEE